MFRSRLLHYAIQRRYSQYTALNGHPNKKLIDVLKQHLANEHANPDCNPYKLKAFKNAIDAISAIETPITSLRDLKTVRGIGPGILSRLEEHIPEKDYSSNVLVKREQSREEVRRLSDTLEVKELRSIPGVGPTKATQLHKAGCHSLDDLRNNPEYQSMLSPSQLLNFKYLSYLNAPVKKEDSATVLEYIKDNLVLSAFEVHLAGGCRRQPDKYHEIDIMLFHPSYNNITIPKNPPGRTDTRGQVTIPFMNTTIPSSYPTSELLSKALTPLTRRGFLADTLKSTNTKWMGFAAIPTKNSSGFWELPPEDERDFCRLNISLVPPKSKGAALIALTGDGIFVRHIQDKARRLGLYLNEFGLWKWEDGVCKLVCSGSEEEIFQHLGMDFVDPTRRNFALLKAAR